MGRSEARHKTKSHAEERLNLGLVWRLAGAAIAAFPVFPLGAVTFKANDASKYNGVM